MSDEEIPVMRDEKGRILPGSKLGRFAKDVSKISAAQLKRERKQMQKTINEEAQSLAAEMLNEKLGDVLNGVYEQAMAGDVKAMALWLKHSTPVAPQAPKLVDSELLTRMQNEPPEQIIQSTVRAMAAGEVDVMLGKEIISACKASIESNFTDRFRKLMKKASRDNLSFIDIMGDLQKIAEDIEPVMIEHEGDGHA